MNPHQKVLFVDAANGFYRLGRYPIGDFSARSIWGCTCRASYNSLNIGVGLLAGSISPDPTGCSSRGFPSVGAGFYVSSVGGAGLVFDNLGINLVAIVGQAAVPSILYLNRVHGEEIEVTVEPVDLRQVWERGRGGFYGLLDHTWERFGSSYATDPRILAVGPAAEVTDFGAIGSVPIMTASSPGRHVGRSAAASAASCCSSTASPR